MHAELPLLKDRGFAAALGNDAAAISSGSGTGERSLVGRGIANPDKKITEAREQEKVKKRGEWEFRSILQNFEPTCPFGHGISNFNDKDFENHLKLQKKSNFKQIFCYALKYKGVLETGDAKVLISLPSAQRRHAMEGL